MRLPCRHIFKYLTENDENTFNPELIADRWTLQYNCTLDISQRSTVIATMGTPVRQPSTMTTNQKFRKATGKLQKLAGLLAQEGMSVYRERMDIIDQLIDFWQEGKKCTLVETVELQVDDLDEGIIAQGTEDVQDEVVDTNAGEIIVGDMEDTNDAVEVQDNVNQDVSENHDDTNHDIDLSTVQLPPMGRRRGRPKGTVNRIIGLPRKKNGDKEQKKQSKGQKRGRVAKENLSQPSKKLCTTLHLSKIPGSSEWTCK